MKLTIDDLKVDGYAKQRCQAEQIVNEELLEVKGGYNPLVIAGGLVVGAAAGGYAVGTGIAWLVGLYD